MGFLKTFLLKRAISRVVRTSDSIVIIVTKGLREKNKDHRLDRVIISNLDPETVDAIVPNPIELFLN